MFWHDGGCRTALFDILKNKNPLERGTVEGDSPVLVI